MPCSCAPRLICFVPDSSHGDGWGSNRGPDGGRSWLNIFWTSPRCGPILLGGWTGGGGCPHMIPFPSPHDSIACVLFGAEGVHWFDAGCAFGWDEACDCREGGEDQHCDCDRQRVVGADVVELACHQVAA